MSEYTLYGRFTQDVLGTSAGQFVSSSSLCHDYYKRVPLSAPELDTLLDRVGPEEIAISLTSKAGMRPEHYVEVLERRWAGLGPQEPAEGDALPRRRGPEAAGTRVIHEAGLSAPTVHGGARQRARARRAMVSSVASASRCSHLIKHPARYRLTWATIVIVITLTMVLLVFGID